MTTYYLELSEFSHDADISKISTETLKEVINDFTNELNNRCSKQNLNIHNVMESVCPRCGKDAFVVEDKIQYCNKCNYMQGQTAP